MSFTNSFIDLFKPLPTNTIALRLHRKLGNVTAISGDDNNKVSLRLAIQVVEDPIWFGIFSQIIIALQKESIVNVDLIAVRSINGSVGNSIIHKIARHPVISYLIASKWIRLYKNFRPNVAYRSSKLSDTFYNVEDSRTAARLFHGLNDRSVCIDELKVHNIFIGDLVIDTYLRFKPSPKFDTADKFVKKILIQVCKDIRRATHYFKEYNPNAYLTSYTTYIQHGVAVRVALSLGIPVFSFGSLQHFFKKNSSNDWFHTPYSDRYKNLFNTISNKSGALKLAEDSLSNRIAGHKDFSTSYMRGSAYSNNSDIGADVSGHYIIFLHDFFDSPHCYDEMIFNDFWSWTLHTIDFLREKKLSFSLKPHPNQQSESDSVVNKLKSLFPDVAFISSSVSNKDLVDAGIKCGVSVYGTVAHELAFLGVSTVCAAKHPHSSFDFCLTAKNISEYEEYLLSPISKITLPEMRLQSLQFYYMHNLYGGKDALRLKELWGSYFWSTANSEWPAAESTLNSIVRTSGYKKMIQQIRKAN